MAVYPTADGRASPGEGLESGATGPSIILQRRLELLLGFGLEVVADADAGAGVPAQDGLVVARRPDGLGLLEELHGLANPGAGDLAASRTPLAQPGQAATFPGDARVVQPLVL